MSNVWLTIPSARPPAEAERVLSKWKAQGYKVVLQRDDTSDSSFLSHRTADRVIERGYQGYAEAVNFLAREVLTTDPSCDWIVAAGDDTEPDMTKTADEIAAECSRYFAQKYFEAIDRLGFIPPGHSSVKSRTFGVMQPTGDRFAGGSIDRICGSPWMGREWCQRINQGRGPLWPEYTHMFVDEELQAVALKYGVLWQRPDLTHMHHHFMRECDDVNSPAVTKPIPPHLVEANSPAHWNKFKRLFEERKAAGFPGSEPL